MFNSDEIRAVCRPNDDALVITLPIANCEVKRILIDNGSSANVLFLSTLKEMELDESNIEHTGIVLTGFNGESTRAVGTLRLPVYVGGENKLTNFLLWIVHRHTT